MKKPLKQVRLEADTWVMANSHANESGRPLQTEVNRRLRHSYNTVSSVEMLTEAATRRERRAGR